MWQRRKQKHKISNQSLLLVVVLAQFRSCQWCQLQHKAINSNRWTVVLSSFLEITTFFSIWVRCPQMHCALWKTPTEPICIDVTINMENFITKCVTQQLLQQRTDKAHRSLQRSFVSALCLLWISNRPTHSEMVWLSSKSTCSYANSMVPKAFVILRSLHHTMQTSSNECNSRGSVESFQIPRFLWKARISCKSNYAM